MTNDIGYTPPTKWVWADENGGQFSSINRPTAGARFDQTLPVGDHRFQLYSLATPNGVKVTVMFEELLELGITEAEYDAWPIKIIDGEQFGSGFVELNPNSKIPALADHSFSPPLRIFESGSILLYLAERFKAFLPTDIPARTETVNWLFWQMGSAPYLGGGFGHFYKYAPEPMQYPIDRFTMETKRQLDVLNQNLADREYIAGGDYTIADIAIWPWYGAVVLNVVYEAAEFLSVEEYPNVIRWAESISERPAVKRGIRVNRTWGPEDEQVAERHSAADFK